MRHRAVPEELRMRLLWIAASLAFLPSASIALEIPFGQRIAELSFQLDTFDPLGGVSDSASSGPYSISGIGDTDTVSIRELDVTGGPRALVLPFAVDLGTVNAVIDPDGFDPPTEISFNLRYSGAASIDIQSNSPSEVPIDPTTLEASITALSIPVTIDLSIFIDDTEVFSQARDAQNRAAVGARFFFTDTPEVGLDEIRLSQFSGSTGTRAKWQVRISDLVEQQFGGSLVSTDLPAGLPFIEAEANVFITLLPEPSLAPLLVVGAAAALRRRRRGVR